MCDTIFIVKEITTRKEKIMTTVPCYDVEAIRIAELADRFETTDCEVIEALFDALDDNNIDLSEYIQ